MVYRLVFSITIVLTLSCTQIDRDNILDPKNTSSRTESVVLLESFINTSDNESSPIVRYALETNNNLQVDYPDRLILLEYHRNRSNPAFNDSLTVDNNLMLHNIYQSANSSTISGGVPDSYVNGAVRREQGAYSETELANRLKIHIEEQLALIGEYTIELDFIFSDSTLNGNYRIARLANKSSGEMKLRIVATSDEGDKGRWSVRSVKVISIRAIDNGEYVEGTFSLEMVPANINRVIAVLKNNEDTVVLHAIEKEVL